MAGQTDSEKSKYAHLDRLSTEALEEFLRADIDSPDNDNDEVIFHILEVIEQREKAHPTGRLSDVDQMWADFQQYYNVPEGEGLSLYPDEAESDDESLLAETPQKLTATKVARFHMRRVLIAAAIVACLVVFAMPPALGYQNFLQMIGKWTESVFHFGSYATAPGSPQNGGTANGTKHMGEYESLQAALDNYEITENVVPTWIADGFELDSVTVTESPEFQIIEFNALYESATGKSISISVVKRNALNSSVYEKDDDTVIPYTVGGVTHYIFENNERTVTTWYAEGLECSIRADLSLDEIEKMIDSIYER